METKKELFGIELEKYLEAGKKEKERILDSLERQTGMWRESIIPDSTWQVDCFFPFCFQGSTPASFSHVNISYDRVRC